jgi:hypothetical protein
MKKICLVLCVSVAVLTLFAATKVGAICDTNLPAGWCFEKNGYRVEVADPNGTPIPNGGTFPVIVDGNSVYTYKITKTTAKRLFNGVDILIPVCSESLGNPLSYFCGTPTNPLCFGKLYKGGSGDPLTRFGFGLTTNDTWNWSLFTDKDTIAVSFTIQGIKYASPNAMLVKVGLIFSDSIYGQILAPACGLITAPTFPPQVPQTTKKEENILGIDVCMESTDQSGCPTKIYSCSDSSYSACNCPDSKPPRVEWTKTTLLDHKIDLETLFQAWTDYDSRCRKAHSLVEGSCQISTYLPDGSLYTYTYPAISGKVFKPSSNLGLSGVTMQMCPAGGGCNTSVKTNALGKYSLCLGTTPWTGTVTPLKTGYTFTPISCGDNGTPSDGTCTYSTVSGDRTGNYRQQ